MRKRIHPAIAIAAMVCISALIISAEIHAHDPLLSLKLVAIGIIGALVGIKLRKYLT